MTNKSKTPKPTRKNSGSADCRGIKPQRLLTPKDEEKSKTPKKK